MASTEALYQDLRDRSKSAKHANGNGTGPKRNIEKRQTMMVPSGTHLTILSWSRNFVFGLAVAIDRHCRGTTAVAVPRARLASFLSLNEKRLLMEIGPLTVQYVKGAENSSVWQGAHNLKD